MKLLRALPVLLLAAWLAAWIIFSWPAIQDDALIHLRYADFLYSSHFITFDGVHRSYGASSLLYVGLLALLRSFTGSPSLPRAVSTAFHLLLFAGVAWLYLRPGRVRSSRAQWFTLSLLLLLAAPSAVRWLDDGMETGVALCLIAVLVWQMHRLSLCVQTTAGAYLSCFAIGFGLVLLRTELASAALFASVIVFLARDKGRPRFRSVAGSSHFVAGAGFAVIGIRLVMHSVLPDTALAKAHGIAGFGGSLRAAATVLSGALLFGLGMLALWLLSAVMVLRLRPRSRMPAVVANAIFPFVLLAAALRGQEIQGARYLVWCFFFSICWNLLEMAQAARDGSRAESSGAPAFIVFVVCCLAALPLESRLMYRVLATRANTMKLLMAEDLAGPLHNSLGVASDVGYLSYFSQSQICDLAGLVNGRAAAAMTGEERLRRCAAQAPAFALLNAGQAGAFATVFDFSKWQVCGQYDFGNLRVPDRHFLIVAPRVAAAACRATGYTVAPASTALVESNYP